MRKLLLLWYLAFTMFLTARPQGEPFTQSIINTKPAGTANDYRLMHPYEIIYAKDTHLYITEKVGRVVRVDPATGLRQIILDHRASTFLNITRDGSGAATGIGQDGMMGMALHPNFGLGTGQDSIFIAYTRSAGNVRISRFKYNSGASPSLTNETVLIQGLPANGDHSSGRLIVGADDKLYYSCGDLGANQFGNRCSPVRAQVLPTAAQVSGANYANYSGKILRLNMDGTIPADNPVWNGVRSHIFTIGHRNPQGLVWQKNGTNGTAYPVMTPAGKLFSSEHGPRTDDEINVLQGGRNYGWPNIAGYQDNINYEYVNWSSSGSCSSTPYTESTIPAGAVVKQESDTTISNFEPPLTTMFATCGGLPTTTCNADGTDWMRFATIAPSSIDFYNVASGLGIPNWYPSLLVPTLRKGTIYRYKMNAAMTGVITDSIPYFRSSNRYRDIALSPDGKKIYVITDSIGSTSGPSGSGTSSLTDRGAIIEFTFTGRDMLEMEHNTPVQRPERNYHINVYPNPASSFVSVQFEKGLHKPIRFQLLNAAGKLVDEGVTNKDVFTIPVGQLAKGVYMLKLYNGYGVEVKLEKIVVQ